MVYHDFVIDAAEVVLYLYLRRFPEGLIFGMFIGKPYFSGPESVGPVHVIDGLVEMIHAVGILEFIRKLRQILFYLRGGKIQRLFDFPLG